MKTFMRQFQLVEKILVYYSSVEGRRDWDFVLPQMNHIYRSIIASRYLFCVEFQIASVPVILYTGTTHQSLQMQPKPILQTQACKSCSKKWSRSISILNKLIYNNNWVLLLMDGLEDQRPLSRLETAFRGLVKSHLASILESKRGYWKQRNTVRWITLGDENSNFFHNMATISHKRNFIVRITNSEGIPNIEHDQKANLLQAAYKERMGCNEFTRIAYDLSSILIEHNLEVLDSEFSQQEIDFVIKSLSDSHAPGPDGFNGLIIKKMPGHFKR